METKHTPTLKPCPFCGGEASKSTGMTGTGEPWNYIECLSCAASAEESVWNTRACNSHDALVLAMQRLVSVQNGFVEAYDKAETFGGRKMGMDDYFALIFPLIEQAKATLKQAAAPKPFESGEK